MAEKKLKEFGEQKVFSVIDESIANGYRGVTWNKLSKGNGYVKSNSIGANARPTENYDHLAIDPFADEPNL